MEELLDMFNSFIGEALEREELLKTEFKEFESKINECVLQANERGTPVQNKKRPKRQASISESDESRDESRVVGPAGRSSARPLHIEEEPRMVEASVMPPPAAPGDVVQKAVRPSRTARLKAQERLKEPNLNEKLRNTNGVVVKVERISTVASNSMAPVARDTEQSPGQHQFTDMEVENDVNQANRLSNGDEGFASTNESVSKPPVAKHETGRDSAQRDASLLVIPQPIPRVELVSDEEMPPPKMPPPKVPVPKTRTKKKAIVKVEKEPEDVPSSSAVSSAESSLSSTDTSTATTKNDTAAPRRTRGRPAGPKKNATGVPNDPTVTLEPIRIKTEKLSIAETEKEEPPRVSDKSEYEDAVGDNSQLSAAIILRPLRIELERMPATDTLPQRVMPDQNGTFAVQNSTFTMNLPTVGGSPEVANGAYTGLCSDTFCIPTQDERPGVADGTFVVEKSASPSAGATCAGITSGGSAKAAHTANASIMTEDDSVVENSPIQTAPAVPVKQPTPKIREMVPAGKSKKPSATAVLRKAASSNAISQKQNELFNPCIQSPIKSRIEAFEKCAYTKATGTPQAQTMGRVQKTISTPSLRGTPAEVYGAIRSAHAKPLGSGTVSTPIPTAAPIVKAASASKMSQMQRKALQQPTTGVTGGGNHSLSREPSWDRATNGTLSAASSTSSLLDEKKKKREEKQRVATQQREAMEREKREHAERLLREKEEKHRKLLQEKQEKIRSEAAKKARKLEEFEKRRLQEEQRALADQKRDELARQLEQQRIDRELLEAVKQSQMKENHEMKLQKQMYQQKLRQQQQQSYLLQQQQQQQQQLAAAAAAKKKATGGARRVKMFTFEMIETDDSTDEDEPTDATKKSKRPPVPSWCQKTEDYRKALAIQSMVEPKVVDRLFSVRPMTPDLRILFPEIDAHKLKRNSSAIWRTPPRYSQLP
ncbi:histone-lysine N-methyltransferase, H3 lysine-79 specific [Anopheles bellator]|uniref:histone-lysine N-methyltransferase, H3 lysine-79 specific n=1 Tax=Anopheles bellator TaxID=139047 RepID=UPI002649352A|nr:histone-lysine N-methyltransferase, H3 lysine-79 specific [Anopheles bellator]